MNKFLTALIFLSIFLLGGCDSISNRLKQKLFEGKFIKQKNNKKGAITDFMDANVEFKGSKATIEFTFMAPYSFTSDYKIEDKFIYVEKVPQFGDIKFEIIDEKTLKYESGLNQLMFIGIYKKEK